MGITFDVDDVAPAVTPLVERALPLASLSAHGLLASSRESLRLVELAFA